MAKRDLWDASNDGKLQETLKLTVADANKCLKAYIQYLVFWDVLSWIIFDANLFYIFHLSRAHNIKNRAITPALVELDSIGAFNPCNIL